MAIKCIEMDSGNGSASIHHLVIKCWIYVWDSCAYACPYLTRHLLGWFVEWTTILLLLVSSPFVTFTRHWFQRAKEHKWFWWSNCLRFLRFSLNHHKCDSTSPSGIWHVFLFHSSCMWKFHRISRALIFVSSFLRNCFLLFLPSSTFVSEVWSSQKLLTLSWWAFSTPNLH